jgi:hypothetical protein
MYECAYVLSLYECVHTQNLPLRLVITWRIVHQETGTIVSRLFNGSNVRAVCAIHGRSGSVGPIRDCWLWCGYFVVSGKPLEGLAMQRCGWGGLAPVWLDAFQRVYGALLQLAFVCVWLFACVFSHWVFVFVCLSMRVGGGEKERERINMCDKCACDTCVYDMCGCVRYEMRWSVSVEFIKRWCVYSRSHSNGRCLACMPVC